MIKQEIKEFRMDYGDYTGLKASVPCSMYSVLLEHKLIDDPFYGENEAYLRALSDKDCSFSADFEVDAGVIAMKNHLLRFHSLDTLAEITLNGVRLGETSNMHRTYTFEVESYLKVGKNTLTVYFSSPTLEMRRKQADHYVMSDYNSLSGIAHLRKAYYMSGWDWAPTLPDMGILRKVELISFDHKIIENVKVRQIHSDDSVDLELELVTRGQDNSDKALATLVSPSGNIYYCGFIKDKGKLTVKSPLLWWPNGLGVQNLYKLTVTLYSDGEVEDTREMNVGLRTLTVCTDKDEYGNQFAFTVNGQKFFSMGANYVPTDSLVARIKDSDIKNLLSDCAKANFNTVRVWGGAYYPPDSFYDACDELGLVVWQDFMVACCNVWLNTENRENMISEFIDNFTRLAHHASLGIVSGNNEMEQALVEWEGYDSPEVRRDYLELYENILPELSREIVPDTFYWPASPSSGGGFDDPNGEERGDGHYWASWNNGVPMEDDRRHHFRYLSEFGFESMPSMRTLEYFASKEDMNIFSPVMERHQKRPEGYMKMIRHIADNYRYPTSISEFSYTSQIMQADAMRISVEHMRRNRGRCMGTIYWQLNDCWPVSSWSSIDYFGRWKALHYAAKRFYSPILLSAHDEGTRVTFNVSNERSAPYSGRLNCYIIDKNNNLIYTYGKDVFVDAFSSLDVTTVDFEKWVSGHEREYYLAYYLTDGSSQLSKGTHLFTKPKSFSYAKPKISTSISGTDTSFSITVSSDVFTSRLFIDFEGVDCVLEDNYIDITDSSFVRINFKTLEPVSSETLRRRLKLTSVYDIGRN